MNSFIYNFRSFNLQLNQMKSICRKMSEEIASLKVLIHDKMMQKFGMEIDLDEMEETALGKMIANQTKLFDYEHQQHIELNKLKVCHVSSLFSCGFTTFIFVFISCRKYLTQKIKSCLPSSKNKSKNIIC